MSFLSVKNVKIRGMSACVPERVEENRDYTLLSKDEIEKYIEKTGVERRHCAVHDGSICTSDLTQKAAEKLLDELGWDKSEIDLLVFVSQTQDYKLPATSCVLQDKMGLPTSCMAFDISFGCSGFLYGLGTIGSIMQGGTMKKALLLVGNTQSEFASYEDRSMYLLLGDAGTATALEYSPGDADTMDFHYMTDGSGRSSVIVPDGGSRNPVNANSFVMEDHGDDVKRTRLHEKMDGLDVFSYAISNVPKSVAALKKQFPFDSDKMDYFLLHQANKFLCEKLRKKVKAPPEKVPYNLHEYGNTSAATIPLLMVTNLSEELQNRRLDLVMTAIGVGFSIGSARVTMGNIVVPEILYL